MHIANIAIMYTRNNHHIVSTNTRHTSSSDSRLSMSWRNRPIFSKLSCFRTYKTFISQIHDPSNEWWYANKQTGEAIRIAEKKFTWTYRTSCCVWALRAESCALLCNNCNINCLCHCISETWNTYHIHVLLLRLLLLLLLLKRAITQHRGLRRRSTKCTQSTVVGIVVAASVIVTVISVHQQTTTIAVILKGQSEKRR